MFDISKAQINLPCPECKFVNKITLDSVRKEKEVICGGCLKTIKLIDKGKSSKKAIKDVNESINNLLGD